ncbi:hypothetical protein RSAG8_05865, partial [Rhizoctonia solani AG-8 WAC10335]
MQSIAERALSIHSAIATTASGCHVPSVLNVSILHPPSRGLYTQQWPHRRPSLEPD